jgi:long-chain acyl-CoA synthetase
LETSRQPDAIYETARRSKATLLYGSPFHFAQLSHCQIASPLPELRMAVSTASTLGGAVAEAFHDRFKLPLTQALGIIEVGLPVLNNAHALDDPTALGQVLPAYQWKIRPHGNDSTTDVGELMLRGPGMFDAYLSPWQTREQVTEDGWFATGDLVEAQANGTLMMRGRSKSVINVAGMKGLPRGNRSRAQRASRHRAVPGVCLQAPNTGIIPGRRVHPDIRSHRSHHPGNPGLL